MTMGLGTAAGGPRQFDPSAINYGSLTSPVSGVDVRGFRAWVAASSPFPYPSTVGPTLRAAFTVGGLAAVGLGTLAAGVALVGLSANAPNPAVAASAPPLIIAATIAVVAWLGWVIRKQWTFTDYWKKWLRLHSFGRDNGLFFLPKSPRPPLSGTVFASPKPGFATDRLVSQTGRRFEIGNFDTQHQDLASPVQVWGYMAIGLERNLPHIMLKSRRNGRRLRGIPVAVNRSQALSLEGDFDKYFTLYAPQEYARDALYVFSPDLMALMIDEVAHLEVEIVDDWIFFYSPKPFDFTSRRTLRRLFRIARIVGAKTFRQTDRYWDDRTGAAFVANEVGMTGRRLRTRISVLAVAGAVIWITVQILRVVNIYN